MSHPLSPFGWNDRVAAHFTDLTLIPARVSRVDRDRFHAVTAEGSVIARAHALPVVGDWVGLRPSGLTDIAYALAMAVPRWSAISRVDPRSEGQEVDFAQPMAANVDIALVVEALDRPIRPARMERAAALAWDGGVRPVIVLSKADRHPDPESVSAAVAERVLGVDVLVTSSTDGTGLEAVRALLRPDRTLVLFGQSGAGKSSLANALVGEQVMDIGAVRHGDHRGRHTTTTRQLIPVPGGGVLMDTPGIRSMGLSDAGEGMDRVFGDLRETAERCRFFDCQHESEPDCAIRVALENGTIGQDRYMSWRKLEREREAAERKLDPVARQKYGAMIKQRGKIGKARARTDPRRIR